ncbi:unnamed protein product [Sphagnum troendelagicum]
MADDGGGVRSSAVFEPARIENKRKFQDVAGEDHHHSSFNAAFDVGDGGGGGAAGTAAAVTSGVSYNSVPPPLSEFELAKQRAELIAARLVTGAEGKRPRTEEVLDDHIKGPSRSNGSDLDQGYAGKDDDNRIGFGNSYQHPPSQEYHQAPQYYNPQGGSTLSRKIDVPNSKVGLVIGKGGETIKYLQHQSGARIQVARDADSDPRLSTRQVELTGNPEQINRAEQLVKDVIAEASAGGPGGLARGFGPPGEQVQVKVPNNKVGLIIGRGGETIKNLQSRCGVRIQVVQNDGETEPGATERLVTLIGNKKATDMAYDLIKEVIDENRVTRGPPGGYHQQGGYRPSGPPQPWVPPAPPPPSYGYQQAPQYMGLPPQYAGPPQPYGGYSQQPTVGYASGWDQRSSAPPAQAQPQSSYDYYGQQGQLQTSQAGTSATDTSGYGYGQQGYYSGYQQQPPAAGYGDLSAAYTQPGYGQQGYAQQGYNAGYGYAQPTQVDQPSLSQAAYAYNQPQTGYTTQPNESAGSAAAPYDYNTAAVPTSSSAAATTQPAAAPIAQN